MPVAFALCLLLTPPSLTAPVTVKYTGRVADLLAQISKQSGTTLTAGRKEGAEILIVALDKAPLDETMERIAWATFGAWERDSNGVYKLVRDAAEERRAEQAYIAEAAACATKSIARYREGVLRKGATDQEVSEASMPKGKVPGASPIPAPDARLLARLAGLIAPRDLVSLRKRNEEIVFSNLPTRAQRPLGPAADQALRQYIAGKGEVLGAHRPERILLKGYVTPSGGSLVVNLFTAKGDSLDRVVRVPYLTLESDRPLSPTPKELLDAIPPDMAVPLSPISQAFRPDIKWGFEGVGVRPEQLAKVPEFMRRLRDPERYEPLATLATDLWTAAAARVGRNLVMNMDDRFLVPMSSGPGGPATMRNYLEFWSPDNVRMAPGWLLGRPAMLNSPWGHRIDRAALGRYVRSPHPYLSMGWLEAGADLIAKGGVPVIPSWVSQYIYWAGMGQVPTFASGDWKLERVYASLPEVHRRAWIAGRPVDIASLPVPAKVALADWATLVEYVERGKHSAFTLEPTVRFPDGMVTEGWLRSDFKEESGFATRFPQAGGTFGEQWHTLDSLAWFLKASFDRAKDVRIQESTRQTLRLWGEIEDGVSTIPYTLMQHAPDPTKYVPWDQARPEVSKAIREAMSRVKIGMSTGIGEIRG